jgi:phage N-6-adenine-methyltransferase
VRQPSEEYRTSDLSRSLDGTMIKTELTVIDGGANLVRYDAACRALAEAKSVDEVKDILDKSVALKAYARQAKNKDLEADAAEIRIRAERRIGEMMASSPKAKGGAEKGVGRRGKECGLLENPHSAASLAEAGIDKNLADRSRKAAKLEEADFEERLVGLRERITSESKKAALDIFGSDPRGTIGTGENEWHTPAEYIERARRVLGKIDLDPASSETAQATVIAEQYFSKDDSGLGRFWYGKVWLNPPYAQPLIADFMAKLIEEIEAEHTEEAIALTHNYTDTAWFQSAAASARAICFTRGRIRFVSPDGTLAAPTQGQTFFYFGPNPQKFVEEFADVGFVVELIL